MPPKNHDIDATGVLFEDDIGLDDGGLSTNLPQLEKIPHEWRFQLAWPNIIVFSVAHIFALYGIYLVFVATHPLTLVFTSVLYWYAIIGTLVGTHRLWSHKSFRASRGLEWFLMFGTVLAMEHAVLRWARDHRVHHKFSDTDADHVNSKRGLFFSHIGWVMVRKHPEVMAKGRQIDVSDLLNNPVVMFNYKYYTALNLVFAMFIPVVVPVILWSESWMTAFCVSFALRWMSTSHAVFSINSLAHAIGNRPYDQHIRPAQNWLVTLVTGGEGFHNFHHAFPWDYRAAELGFSNWSRLFIETCARFGLASDLKQVSREMIEKRVRRTGDGSHAIWGWDDPDQSTAERDMAIRTHHPDES